jgi:hypothetical protein
LRIALVARVFPHSFIHGRRHQKKRQSLAKHKVDIKSSAATMYWFYQIGGWLAD